MLGTDRKNYEIKLHALFPQATPEQITRIRKGAADLANGADWDETVEWVKAAPTPNKEDA